MKKKISLIVLFMLMAISLASIIYMKISSSPDMILKTFRTMKSYKCTAVYTLINERSKREETTLQYFLSEKGNVVVFGNERVQVYNNNGKIVVTNKKDGKAYEISKENYNFYELTFINYLSKFMNDKSNLEVVYDKEVNCRYYKVTIPLEENNPNIDKGILYINIADKVPDRLLILNNNGMITFEVKYSNFEFNPDLDVEIMRCN